METTAEGEKGRQMGPLTAPPSGHQVTLVDSLPSSLSVTSSVTAALGWCLIFQFVVTLLNLIGAELDG